MESPVRIYLGAAIVINLLLFGTTVCSNVLPQMIPVAVSDRATRLDRNNTSWATSKPSTPDISINELNPKESLSEEHTEKNAKYKDRGRVRYFSQPKFSTESSLRRIKISTEVATLVIVTPTPEMKKSVEVMAIDKNIKITGNSSSTTPSSEEKEQSVEEYDSQDDEDEDENREFEKFTSNKFHEDFFTMSNFDDAKNSFNHKVKQNYMSPSHGFSNFFPGETSFAYSEHSNNNNHKSQSFFDFESELTTPKNDFFDKRYQEISGSIIQKLESIKTKSPPPTKPDIQKVVKDKVELESLSNRTPSNKSTVFIKNSKEIHLSDNEGAAGSTNTALSDVHGTSIYYEMSVLSTETYAINHSNDYDCDNETLPSDITVSSSSEEELISVNSTKPTVLEVSTRQQFPDPTEENKPDFIVSSTVVPFSSSAGILPTQNITSSTERTSMKYFSSVSRNKNYFKRLNLSGINDSTNNITPQSDVSSYIPYYRKFSQTTPRNRPIWMAPKRNATKISFSRNTPPTTIYSEHFNIKDKIMNTIKPKQVLETTLSTVSSNIDPVLQSEISGIKKIVHTQSTPDNSISSLWKRGSAKYSTTTVESSAASNLNEMEIPPTSIAWALASLRNPSPLRNPLNTTTSTQKSIDENELQNVEDILDKLNANITSSTTMISSSTSEDAHTKNTEVERNKLHWRSTFAEVSPSSTEDGIAVTEAKSEKLAAESSIFAQSTAEYPVTGTIKDKPKIFVPNWIPTTVLSEKMTQSKPIPLVHAKRPTGFESITKLPSGVTTPRDEIIENFESNGIITKGKLANDYEITTIRFSYIPTESADITEENISKTETTTESSWHPIIPTRTKFTSMKDIFVTTYRPKYITTTETVEESSIASEMTSTAIDVSSQLLHNITDILSGPTETQELTTLTKISSTENILQDKMEVNYIDINLITEVSSEKIHTDRAKPMVEETTGVDYVETTKSKTDAITEEVYAKTIKTTSEVTIPTTEAATEESIQPVSVRVTTLTTPATFTTTLMPTTSFTSTALEETTTILVEVVTEINTEKEKLKTTTLNFVTETEMDSEVTTECSSEESDNANEVLTQNIPASITTTIIMPTTEKASSTTENQIATTEEVIKTDEEIEGPTQIYTTERVTTAEIISKVIILEDKTESSDISLETTTNKEEDLKPVSEEVTPSTVDCSTENELTTKAVNILEDITDYGEMTTEASSRVLSEESGTAADVAIAVSTIGVIALVLLIGLLIVVRRRGRRGIYAQRCTPVSLDAYSLDSVSVGHRKGNHRLRASKRSYGNPAYDDEVTSHPMQYPALANFALDIESMTAEFAEIPSVTVRHEDVPPGCEDKNRYSNVLPLPETRVPLVRINNDPTTEYINANYITGPGNIRNYYIACQAPLSNTVVDFWRMIWEQNSRLVVMLTEYMENGVEKCYEYLPPSEITDNKRTFGDFKIILKKREQRDKYAISSVQLINLATRTWREVTHLWYFWPAKGVPDDYDSVIDFLSEMRSYMKISQTAKEYDEEGVEVIYGDQIRSSYGNLAKLRSDEHNSSNGVNVYSPAKAEEVMRRHANGTLGRMKAASEIEGVRPCVVTCASGAGRSAVLIALDISARALAAGCADVPRAVRHLRAQRPHSLSNRHHYILLYKVLSEYGKRLMGGGVDTI